MQEYDYVKIFKGLADKTRQDILGLLTAEEKNVTDICAQFRIAQPTVSHHLRILKDCDLLDSRKEGKNIYYFANKNVVNDVLGNVVKRMNGRA